MRFLQGLDEQWLFLEAQKVKESVFGKKVFIRGVVEFSNYCREDCLYCGLRRSNRSLSRYRLSETEILDCALLGIHSGIKTIVLQSGDDLSYGTGKVAKIIRDIRKLGDVVIALSLGERNRDELEIWRESGADRYLLKMETFDRNLYAIMRPGKIFEERLKVILNAKELGYETGSGIIVGLPGQSLHSLATDILRLTDLKLEMIAVGPFIPHPDTPLKDAPPGDPLLTIRAIAILRLLNPYANIPSTTALQFFGEEWRIWGLSAGGNVVMPSLTREDVKDLYNIYPGKNKGYNYVTDLLQETVEMIRRAGAEPSFEKGYSPRGSYEKSTQK
ncbi:MAG: [FeFe] hydrogenase H-cluster radical SAM maturase HydE [candidate division WOR-3 bacterium]